MFGTLLSLLFQVPGLDFEKPLDHFEAFSGKMSVTKAEWQDAHIQFIGITIWVLGCLKEECSKSWGVYISEFVDQVLVNNII